MPSSQVQNFDITILGTATPYTVIAEYQGLTADGLLYHDALQPDWAKMLGPLSATHIPPGESSILDIGGILFTELFQGRLRDLWIEATTQLENNQRLRVRLNIGPPAVAALPWETLTDPSRRRLLAADRSFSLVRVATNVEFVGRARSIQTESPARLLIVSVDETEEVDSLDRASEINRIQAVLSPAMPSHIQVDVLQGRINIQALRQGLADYRPDILHIISHGEADGLYLWQDSELILVKASQLAALLALTDSIKLVFLNACLVGQPDNAVPFASLAQRLLQTGIPAVIAMQFEILDRVAAEFARLLYEALVNSSHPGEIDVAMSIARNGLYIDDPDRIDFATPVLWLNAPNGLILQIGSTETATVPTSEQSPAPAPLPEPLSGRTPPPLILDFDEKELWFDQLPESVALLELRYDYIDRKRKVEVDLRALREAQDAQQSSKPIDVQKVSERLEAFKMQRKYIDKMLAQLSQFE